MKESKESTPVSVKYHCIKCGNTWGGEKEIESHGICPRCFAVWNKDRQKSKNLIQCFGEFKERNDVDCASCSVQKFCKEYHGIR